MGPPCTFENWSGMIDSEAESKKVDFKDKEKFIRASRQQELVIIRVKKITKLNTHS